MTTNTTARPRPTTWLELTGTILGRHVVTPVRTARDVLARQTRTTPGRLRILFTLGVVLTAAVWVSANAIVSNAHRTVTAMNDETAPAIIAAGRAQVSLARMDAAHAYSSARNPGATALSQMYLSTRKTGAKELGQALANNTAGGEAASLLRSAEKGMDGYGRLSTYGRVSYVAHFLHSPDDGILHDIGRARVLNRSTFDDQRSSAWLSPAILVLYLVPALALLALLGYAQRFLTRRFRRWLNVPLLAATLVVILPFSGWIVYQVVHTTTQIERGERSLTRITNLLQSRTLVAEAEAEELRALSAGPDRWVSDRMDELVDTPLTEPITPPVGTGRRIDTITTSEVNVGAILDTWKGMSPEGRDVIGKARTDFQAFTTADEALDENSRLGDGAQREIPARELHDNAVRLNNSLAQLTAVELDRFNATMNSAASRSGLDVAVPLVALGSVVLMLAGFAPRLNEYRGMP